MKELKFMIAAIYFVMLIGTASAAIGYSAVTYPTPTFSYSSSYATTYWPILNNQQALCSGRQDLLLQVAPAGCQPTVVTSDLLAEQDVPVFCQVEALQVNPLIDLKSIDSMTFSGRYPPQVSGTGFHPAQAAVYSGTQLLGNPLYNNLGYVVVVLKRQANESALPDSVQLNLTAQLQYNSYNALGVGQANFIMPVMNDAQWAANVSAKNAQSFWQGRYFARVESADSNFATVSIYYGIDKISTTRVDKGKTSSNIFVPGFSSCSAALQIAYDGFQASENRAVLEVSDEKGTDTITAYGGSSLLSSGTMFYNNKCSVSNIQINQNNLNYGSVDITCNGNKFSLELKSQTDTMPTSTTPSAASPPPKIVNSNKYYLMAIDNYKATVSKYSSETYAKLALVNAIALAANAGDGVSEKDLINQYLNAYPSDDKAVTEGYKTRLDALAKTNFANAVASTIIDGRAVTITLKRFEKGSIDKNINVQVNGNLQRDGTNAIKSFKEGDSIPLISGSSVTVSKIYADYVAFSASCGKDTTSNNNNNANMNTGSFNLNEGQSARPCGISFTLERVNAEKLAAIRILPNVHNTETETNLSVTIGIEKRAIQLSPEKTKEMISNLNDSIKKWESISKTLGNVVTGLKSACFATTAVLTVKNLVFSGESMARRKVMQGDGVDVGWSKRCTDAFTAKKALDADGSLVSTNEPYVSVSDCINKNSPAIEKAVKARTDLMSTINKELAASDTASNAKTKSTFFGAVIDTDVSAKAALASLPNNVPAGERVTVNNKEINLKDYATTTLTATNWDAHAITYSQISDFELYSRLLSSDVSDVDKEAARKELVSIITNVDATIASNALQNKKAEDAKTLTYQVNRITQDTAKIYAYSGNKFNPTSNKADQLKGAIATDTTNTGQPVQIVDINGKDYALILKEFADNSGANKYSVTKVYSVDTTYNTAELTNTVVAASAPPASLANSPGAPVTLTSNMIDLKGMIFQLVDSASCSNKYPSPKVQYFETEPNKGLPAIVPVDTAHGWYAATEQSSFGLASGQTSSYQSSGRVVSFWLCNVGKDGAVDFDKVGRGDDNCQQFNLNTGQSLSEFACMDASSTKALVNRAISRLNQAAQQHTSGLQKALFTDAGGSTERIDVGTPAAGITAAQCEDYMSASDCHILFNLCDPVICPPSRCNFGGQYPVANVPQTGIIGSTLLCLPNAKEGIKIPVCLTGIEAGVDGFVSLLKNHRDCLQQNLDTGQTVGICDQIYSVYACEFFWNQVAPAAQTLLPKLVETAYGQGTKGGGEYLTIANAWKNTQDAMTYFTQTYGVNSLKAFQARSAEEYGSLFCKAFISMKAPTSIKTLVEPDSPPQFNAFFSSTKFTDATIPATSQYKVFYHIYAGKDSGVYYEVYLKNPTGTSYYATAQTVIIASGFVTKDQYASETKDFTAPEGYQQLCVRVNDQEQCGFKEVSTSFAVNYLTDSIASDAITTNGITTESGCISGDPSLSAAVGGLLTGNVQSAAQSGVNPQVYTQGIIRICATNNPGASTDPTRYVEVGNCGDTKTTCWLDKNSVSNAINKNDNIILNSTAATLSQLQTANTQILNGQSYITDAVGAKSQLEDLQKRINTVSSDSDVTSIISSISIIQPQLYDNANKAYASYLIGLTYGTAAGKGLGATVTSTAGTNSGSAAGATSGTTTNAASAIDTSLSTKPAFCALSFTGDTFVDLTNSGKVAAIDSTALTAAYAADTASNLLIAGAMIAPESQVMSASGEVAGTVVNIGGRSFVKNTANSLIGEVTTGGTVVKIGTEAEQVINAASAAKGSITLISASSKGSGLVEGGLQLAKGSSIISNTGNVLGKIGTDTILQKGGVRYFVPVTSKLIKIVGTVALVYQIYDTTCAVTQAINEYNLMSQAIAQADASQNAADVQYINLANWPLSVMNRLGDLKVQLNSLKADSSLSTTCGISSSDIDLVINSIDSLPDNVHLGATTISHNINEVVKVSNGISNDQGRSISADVNTWNDQWKAANGPTILANAKALAQELSTCSISD